MGDLGSYRVRVFAVAFWKTIFVADKFLFKKMNTKIYFCDLNNIIDFRSFLLQLLGIIYLARCSKYMIVFMIKNNLD